MARQVCKECGQIIDDTNGYVKGLIAFGVVALFIGIGYAIAHVQWVG